MKACFSFMMAYLLGLAISQAQSPNVDCANAFEITDPSSYCSGPDEFDTSDAGGSEFEVPDCWDEGENDLWFRFTAVALSVGVTISGESGGDLNDPQVILYRADNCDMIFELGDNACASTSVGDDVASISLDGLMIGANYFIRVSGRFARQGTFQICVNNTNPPVVPGQDCATSSILCDKSSFNILSINGPGAELNEGDGSCLNEGLSTSTEINSTWFKWTCDEAGTLTFDITPLESTNDFDFALYRLTNGIDNCDRELLRCSATESGSDHLCGAPTGLNLTSTDISEDFDCELDDDPNTTEIEDGYVRFIDMVAGESYVLLINNFNDKSGFTMDFGGTGTFLGPTADFEILPDPNDPCGTSTIIVNDLSEAGISNIAEYEWDFGEGATPQTGSGQGPFTINYSSDGEKFIVLRLIAESGCIVTEVKAVDLTACPESLEIVIDSVRNSNCEGIGGGYIEVSGLNGCPILLYNIDGGTFTTENTFEDLDMGDYTIGMLDMNGCEIDTVISIMGAADFTVEAGDDVTLDIDGSPVDLDATTTAMGDITITWDPADGIMCTDGTSNCLNPSVSPTTTTIYTITITDGSGCVSSDMLTVFVDQCNNTNLQLNIDDINDLICRNSNNGFIQVSGQDGVEDYTYSIDGGPFTSSGLFADLTSGQYNISIRDNDGCTVDSLIQIGVLPDFNVDAGDDVTFSRPGDTIMFDASTTASNVTNIEWDPSGNVFCQDGTSNCLDPTVIANAQGTYTIIVTDENGCTSTDIVNIRFVENTDIYIPNVFSPNEDGINDFFTILGDPTIIEGIDEIVIFDRWGNKVYEGRNLAPNDPNSGWDGRFNNSKAEPGVYTWIARVRYISRPDDPEDLQGDITLIR